MTGLFPGSFLQTSPGSQVDFAFPQSPLNFSFIREQSLINRNCEQSPSCDLLRAIDEFNHGDWFDCHETLEELWKKEGGEVRGFYQGILQVAVALHHWREGNFEGAMSLLARGAAHLRGVSPVCQGVDVSGFVADTDRMREVLASLGQAHMSALDERLIPLLRLVRLPNAGKQGSSV
jgi:predicted metal-dependent hydrolase